MDTVSQTRSTAFSASLLLHTGAGAILLLAAYLFQPQAPPAMSAGEIFTVATFDGSSAANTRQADGTPLTIVAPRLPVPTVSQPVRTAPTTTTATQSSVTPVPRVATVKPASSGSKTMSIDEFRRLHPQSAQAGAKSPASLSPNTSSISKIDLAEVGTAGTIDGSGSGQSATAASDARLMTAYETALKRSLRAALIKPASANESLAAQVNFHIAVDGTLSAVVIAKTSGDRAFDEALLAAFAKVKSIGPTPTGKAEALSVYFKLR